MKSLAERHIDRAQRKADNAAHSTQTTNNNLGLAAFRISEANAAIATLSPEEREKLRDMVEEDGFADGVAEAEAGAYDGQGNLRTAGIGVVNQLVVPVAAAMALEGAGTGLAGGVSGNGWGAPPEPTSTPAEGNQGGVALDAQVGAQGGGQGDETKGELPAVNATMKVGDLEAIAAKEGADLTAATNNEQRVAAIEANRNK